MTDRAHSEHGASSCRRWWNCPGSVQLSRGLPNRESIHAAEGTAAHRLAELCLEQGQDAAEYIGRTVEKFNVDADMAEAVQVYLDECRLCVRAAPRPVSSQIESRFDLSLLHPPAPMYGTADYVVQAGGWLWVKDLKYGQGVSVEAEGNPQLKYYALGALLALPPGSVVTHIQACIVQPRAPDGRMIRYTSIDPLELMEWSIELFRRAAATLEPDAPLVPGSWCQFCRAAGKCPAQAAATLAIAQDEFAMPDPRLLPPEERARILRLLPQLEAFATALRDAAKDDLQRGVPVPGWKLVPTRPTQSWVDPEETAGILELVHELSEAERFAPREVISPAKARDFIAGRAYQAAKSAGLKLTRDQAKSGAIIALKPLIRTASSGVTLAPDDDPRPGLPAPGSEFTALPAIGNENADS